MDINPQEIKKTIKNIQLFLKKHIKPNSNVILATSGGPDSQFLLNQIILHQKITKFHIICAHLNHQIRKDSEKDPQFIHTYIKSKNSSFIELITETKNIEKIASEKKQTIEETGRNERYKFFSKLAEKYNTTYILTGHHANDNAETVLLNLIRGAALKGRAGIPPLQKIDPKYNAPEQTMLLRPLLQITKEEILVHLKLSNTPYLIDKTNNENNYTRNKIRNKIIPEIEKINPSFITTLSKNNKTITETLDFIETTTANWLNTHTINNQNNKEISFKSSDFLNNHKIIQKEIIKQTYKKLIKNTKNITTENINEIILLIKNNIGNKEKKLQQTIFTINQGVIKCKTTQ